MEKERMPSFLKKALLFLRFRSVLAKILLILTILIVGICVLIYQVISWNYQEEYKENQIYTGFAMLDLVGDEMEEQIVKLDTQLKELLDVTILERIVVSGDIYSNSQTLEVVRELKRMSDENPLIQTVFIYVENSDALLSSDQTVLPLEETTKQNVIRAYWQRGDQPELFFYEGEMYLFCEIPEGRQMALCAVEISRDVLFAGFKENMETLKMNEPVYPFFDGVPLFGEQVEYPPSSAFQIVSEEERNFGDVLCELSGDRGALLAHNSGTLNIQLLAFLEDTENPLSLKEFMVQGLPVWGISLVLVLLAGVVLVIVIYRPLARTLNYMLSQRSPGVSKTMPKNIRNEFELMTGLFREQKKYEQGLNELLQKTGEAVADRVFLDILEGDEQNEDSVRSLLSRIRGDYDREANYLLILIDLVKEEEDLLATSEREMYKILIRQFSAEYWYGKALLNVLNRKDQQETLVLAFSKECSVRQINAMVAEYVEGCCNRLTPYSCTPVLGVSSLRKDLFSLADAFVEARSQLQEKMYYSTYSKDPKDVLTIYKNKIHLCLEQMVREPEEAERELGSILKNGMQYPEEIPLIWLHYMDSVMEYLLRYRIPCEPHWQEWRKMFGEDINNLSIRKDLQEVARKFYAETSVKLREVTGYVQMQYLDLAERYIKNHYDDSNLSLVVVSENCGISKGYLSKLFTQYTKESFTEYLNQYRVKQACELLDTTSFTILEVGLKTGFNSPQSFSRVFKKYMSCTPTQYRVQKRGEQ